MPIINFIVVGLNSQEITATVETILPVCSLGGHHIHVVSPDPFDYVHDGLMTLWNDDGISLFDAMDVPFQSIDGNQFVLFINAGDFLNTHVFLQFKDCIRQDLLEFDVVVYSSIIGGLTKFLNKPRNASGKPSPRNVCHQAFIYRARLHTPLAKYSSLSADRYFMIDTLRKNVWAYRFLPISTFSYGGLSSNLTMRSVKQRVKANGWRRPKDSALWIIKYTFGHNFHRLLMIFKFFTIDPFLSRCYIHENAYGFSRFRVSRKRQGIPKRYF